MLPAIIAASRCFFQFRKKVSRSSPSCICKFIKALYEKIFVVPSKGWCSFCKCSHISCAVFRLETWSTYSSLKCMMISIQESRSLLFQFRCTHLQLLRALQMIRQLFLSSSSFSGLKLSPTGLLDLVYIVIFKVGHFPRKCFITSQRPHKTC